MKTKHRINLLCFCLLICLSPVISRAAVPRDAIVLNNGKLSVKLRQAPFNDVVQALSEKTGINIYIFDDTAKKTLTVEFSDRQLGSGLRSLFKDINYAIVYHAGLENGNVFWADNILKKSDGKFRNSVSGLSTGMNGTKRIDSRNSGKTVKSGGSGRSTYSNNISGKRPENNSLQGSKSGNDIVNNYRSYRGNESTSNSNNQSGSNETGALSNARDGSENSSEYSGGYGETYNPDDIPSWYHDGMSTAEGKIRYKMDLLEKDIESGRAEREYQLRVAISGEKAALSPEEQMESYYNRLEELSEDKNNES